MQAAVSHEVCVSLVKPSLMYAYNTGARLHQAVNHSCLPQLQSTAGVPTISRPLFFFGMTHMMNIDLDALNSCVENMKSLLKDGLLACDIWNVQDGLSLAGYNSQPAAVGLFTQLTNELVSTLRDSGFPGLNRYYLLDMEGDHISLIIRHGDTLLQGLLLNSKKVNLGVLLSVALPRAQEQVAKACQ